MNDESELMFDDDDELSEADLQFMEALESLSKSDTADNEYVESIHGDDGEPTGEPSDEGEENPDGEGDGDFRIDSDADEPGESEGESSAPDHLESGEGDEIHEGEDDLEFDDLTREHDLDESQDDGPQLGDDDDYDEDFENSDAQVEEEFGEGERGNTESEIEDLDEYERQRDEAKHDSETDDSESDDSEDHLENSDEANDREDENDPQYDSSDEHSEDRSHDESIAESEQEPQEGIFEGIPEAPELCFAPGTLILTESGLRPIDEIHVGELVLTHRNRWRRVTAMMRNTSDTIVVRGHGHPGIETTENHPFLVRRHRKGTDSKWVKWMPAKDLMNNRRDCTLANSSVRNNNGWYWMTPINVESLEIPEIENRNFEMNDDFWWMVGRWLGDGHVNRNTQIVISCGKHEATEVDYMLNRVRDRIGGDESEPYKLNWYRNTGRTTMTFKVTHRGLANWLTNEFGRYAYGKTIPSWALGMKENSRAALLAGYVSADGHNDGRKIQTTTVSRRLALGIRLLSESLDNRVAMTVHEQKTDVIEGRQVDIHSESWHVNWLNIREREWCGSDEDHSWSKVRGISVGRKQIEVFNLSVDQDESYIAEGFVVHNCTNHCEDNLDPDHDGECPHCTARLKRERDLWGEIAQDKNGRPILPGDRMRVVVPISFMTMGSVLVANVPNLEVDPKRVAVSTSGKEDEEACWLSGHTISQFTGWHLSDNGPIWTFKKNKKIRFVEKMSDREFQGHGSNDMDGDQLDSEDLIDKFKEQLENELGNSEEGDNGEPEAEAEESDEEEDSSDDEMEDSGDDSEDDSGNQGRDIDEHDSDESSGDSLDETDESEDEEQDNGTVIVTEIARQGSYYAVETRNLNRSVITIYEESPSSSEPWDILTIGVHPDCIDAGACDILHNSDVARVYAISMQYAAVILERHENK